MKLQRLDHFGIEVADLVRAERFYTEVLGLEVVAHLGHQTLLQCGDQNLALFEFHREALSSGDRRNRIERPLGKGHHAFRVSRTDFEAARESLTAAGVECAKMEVLLTPQQGTPMSEITVIGLDLAKHVFQVHGADPDGRPVLRKRLRRRQVLEFFASLSPCLIGMEACAGSHYWGRELQALGHEVRLISP